MENTEDIDIDDSGTGIMNFISAQPLVTVLYVCILIFLLGHDIANGFINSVISEGVRDILLIIIVFTPIFLVFLLVQSMFSISQRQSIIESLVKLYLEITLLFANIYYLIQCITIDTKYAVISQSAEYQSLSQDSSQLYKSVVLYADSVYFSFLNISKVSGSNVTAKIWYVKLLAIVQLSVGMYIIGISLARYFKEKK